MCKSFMLVSLVRFLKAKSCRSIRSPLSDSPFTTELVLNVSVRYFFARVYVYLSMYPCVSQVTVGLITLFSSHVYIGPYTFIGVE